MQALRTAIVLSVLAAPLTAQAAEGPRAMATAARAFLAALDEDQRAQATFPFADAERRRWHFVPARYPGIELGALAPAQKELAHELLHSALSSAGYLKTTGIVRLELILRELARQAGRPGHFRDPGRYSLAVFGEPSAGEPWGWRLQGHHVSLNFSNVDGELVATTPSFLGANPHVVRSGPLAGLRVLGAEEDLARALLASLDENQRRRAVLDVDVPADVILGPGREAAPLEPRGLEARELTEAQRRLLWRLVREYVENLRPELASAQLDRIRSAGIEEISFAWAGGTEVGEPHYYRVQGPTFVIEYDNTQNDANHVHTVLRDLERDFGGDPLREHLERDHRGTARVR